MNKTLNITCSVDKWFLPLKDCNSVTLQPQMSMLSLFLTLSNMRQPEAPLSAVGDTVCPLGILKIYLPWKHGAYKTQTPAHVQGKFSWLMRFKNAGRWHAGDPEGCGRNPRAGVCSGENLAQQSRPWARVASASDRSCLCAGLPASPHIASPKSRSSCCFPGSYSVIVHTFFLRGSLSCLYRCVFLASVVLLWFWSPEAAKSGPRVQGKWSLNSACHRAFIVRDPARQPGGKNKSRTCGDLATNSCPFGSCAGRRGTQLSESSSDLCGAEAGLSWPAVRDLEPRAGWRTACLQVSGHVWGHVSTKCCRGLVRTNWWPPIGHMADLFRAAWYIWFLLNPRNIKRGCSFTKLVGIALKRAWTLRSNCLGSNLSSGPLQVSSSLPHRSVSG